MTQGLNEAFGYELEPTPWTERAGCIGSDPDLFFPGRGESCAPAKAICAPCPVRSECLDYARRWNISFGVWGGTSERERRQLPRTSRPRKLWTATRLDDLCWGDAPINGRAVQTINPRNGAL